MVGPIKGGLININPESISRPGAATGDTFSTVLKDSINKVNNLQVEADAAIQGLAKGETNNIHETMIAIEKANISFNLMVQVRNKLVQAYEEIMRTQV
ncbi:MAG: flagellar hook-basal body complex protein FliE [Deltaproteobacteria bacterium]|nr:flagellar hook-basal body complex protein FliE [Deltaproteobacteria bacterium]